MRFPASFTLPMMSAPLCEAASACPRDSVEKLNSIHSNISFARGWIDVKTNGSVINRPPSCGQQWTREGAREIAHHPFGRLPGRCAVHRLWRAEAVAKFRQHLNLSTNPVGTSGYQVLDLSGNFLEIATPNAMHIRLREPNALIATGMEWPIGDRNHALPPLDFHDSISNFRNF